MSLNLNSTFYLHIHILLLLTSVSFAQTAKVQITKTLDNWHLAASETRFNDYMNVMTADAIYIGTDASENWNKKQFMAFAKPYFDKGKAWSFTALERHIYLTKDNNTAWFDELLNTQMKICRGSGVMIKVKNQWKIQHYVLSMTIPNENTNEIVKLKSVSEDKRIEALKH
jgi:SnoaL-like domain